MLKEKIGMNLGLIIGESHVDTNCQEFLSGIKGILLWLQGFEVRRNKWKFLN